MYSQTKISVTC